MSRGMPQPPVIAAPAIIPLLGRLTKAALMDLAWDLATLRSPGAGTAAVKTDVETRIRVIVETRQAARHGKQHIVDDFNSKHPIGTGVSYTPYENCKPEEVRHSQTRSEAWLLGGHTPAVLIDGVRGCVCLEFLTVRSRQS